MQDLIDRLTSRKFLLTLAFCVYEGIQIAGGVVTPSVGEDLIFKAIAAFLGAEGLADALGRLKPSVPSDPAPTPAELPAATVPVPPVPPV